MTIEQPIEVTWDLLIKYDRPGPRYTSYPTVPEWAPFDEAAYKAALGTAAQSPDAPLSLYIHLPFCRRRCSYCGCTAFVANAPEEIAVYLDHVVREIGLVSKALSPRHTVKQLHWGGGTPTTLDVDQIRALFGAVQTNFSIAPDAEIALEVDARITTREQIDTLRGLGFNRISMGVQDLNETVQHEIGRFQSEQQTRQLFGWCREVGFEGINMDLIYGLPGQTVERWTETIRGIVDIGPDRLAVYSFAHLPAQLPNQRAIDASKLPTGPEKFELFALARRMLLDAGYRAIGMDHFARADDELSHALDERRLNRNFMGYTVVSAEEMAGLGLSAIGEIGGCYAQNEKTFETYYAALDAGRMPVTRGCVLSKDDRIRNWVIRQLMCNFYLDTAELERRFGVQYSVYFEKEETALGEFFDEGFVARDGANLKVLPLGQVFIRNVAMVFDAYLKRPEGHREFSRTV